MSGESPASLSRRARIGMFVGAWLLAVFITNPSGTYWPLVYMFPLGLAAFVFPSSPQGSGTPWLFGLWSLYIVHALFFFRARTTRATVLWFLLLALLLTCNVAGCRSMLNTH